MIKIKNLIYLTTHPSVLTTLTILSFCILNSTFCIAEVRYVSHTGSSTPPYTSWETAADSIQKAIDICEPGDTVLVANGVYQEYLVINTPISLIGSSTDSTIIDGSQVQNPPLNSLINFNENVFIKYFTIKGQGSNQQMSGIVTVNGASLNIDYCKVTDFFDGLFLGNSSSTVSNCIFGNCRTAILDECPNNNCYGIYTSNIIISRNNGIFSAVGFTFGGYPTFINNIVIEEGTNTQTGIFSGQKPGAIIKNNLVGQYRYYGILVGAVTTDTTYIINNYIVNISGSGTTYGAIVTSTGNRTKIENNILKDCYRAIYKINTPTVRSDYNLFWNVQELMGGQPFIGDSNIVADPMFVNDTIPNPQLDFDYHLQAYSPAIDAGNPDILDVDGSRSDIGMFGGPLGEKYTYMDLAPKPPANLTAVYQSNSIHLNWNKNTESDLSHYRIYRDTVPNFIYDISKMIGETEDTTFTDILPDPNKAKNYYYKITAFDNQENQSAASEEVHIIVTGLGEIPPQVVEEYKLLNNYPNPFNPSTTIPYRLKEAGYVKVMVYNILGELVRVLVNQWQEKGYYEVVFSPDVNEKVQGKIGSQGLEFETGYYGNIVSGIYLLRIEVIGEGNIPRFSDMQKMMLVK